MTMRVKILLSIIMATLLCTAALSTVAWIEMRASSISSFEISSKTQLEGINHFISTFFKDATRNAKHLSMGSDVRNAKGQLFTYFNSDVTHHINESKMSEYQIQLTKVLSHMSKSHPSYGAVFMGMEDGGYAQDSSGGNLGNRYDPRKRPWYRQLKESSDDSALSKAYQSTDGNIVVTAMHKIKDNTGNVSGIISVDLDLDEITRLTDELRPGKTGYIILMEKDGTILADSVHKNYIAKNVYDTGSEGLEFLGAKESGFYEVDVDGEAYLATVMSSRDYDVKMIMLITEGEILAPMHETLKFFLGIGLAIAILLSIAALFIAGSIAKPINIMCAAAKEIAGGNFSVRLDGDSFTGEMAELNTNLRFMVEKLVESLELSDQKAKEAEEKSIAAEAATKDAEEAKAKAESAKREGMLQAAGTLEGIVGEITSSSRELSNHVADATEGSRTQLERTTEAATAMEQMNASVLEVASNASRAAESAEDAKGKAVEGAGIVTEVVGSIEQLSDEARNLELGLNQLGKEAEGIGSVMNVITDIADQTNLLALNAAIEAARAGDAGRGFAVVADEVRKLAEKTMDATREVGEAVTSIQNGTTQNIAGMQKTVKTVEHSTMLTGKAGDSLQEIMTIVEDTADQVRAIATASEEQSAASEQISHGTTEVNRIANDTAVTMQHSEESVERLNGLSGELNSLITDLQNS